jgi:hypothetical protein
MPGHVIHRVPKSNPTGSKVDKAQPGARPGVAQVHPGAISEKPWKDWDPEIPRGVSRILRPTFQIRGNPCPRTWGHMIWRIGNLCFGNMKTHVSDVRRPTTHDQKVGCLHIWRKPIQVLTINTHWHSNIS